MIAAVRNWIGRKRGYGGCYRCGGTWDYAKEHSTPYGDTGLDAPFDDSGACSPLCEKCWSALTPSERVPFYEEMWAEWIRQGTMLPPRLRDNFLIHYGDEKHDKIMAAVEAGL